jgi:hypothetical protein
MKRMNEADRAASKGETPDESEPPPTDGPDDSPVPEPELESKETERDEKGKFAKGKGNPRHDPRAAVEKATAKAAEATRLLAERDAKIADLERRVSEREAPVKAKPALSQVPEGGPEEADFADQPDPYASYLAARAEWRAEQAVERKWAEREARAAAKQAADAATSRFDAATKDDPDFPKYFAAVDDTLTAAGFHPQAPVPAVMLDAIAASEIGPDIVRFLGSHPEELIQLAKDVIGTPREAATAVRRLLEATVKASTPALSAAVSTGSAAALPRTSAVPITPVRTSREPAPDKDLTDKPFGRDYVREMNRKERRGA